MGSLALRLVPSCRGASTGRSLDTLARYKLVYSGKVSDVPERERNNRLVTHRWVVDPAQDNEIAIGLMGWSTHSPGPQRPMPARTAP